MTTLAGILVVDDAATVRMFHHRVLADAGWAVDQAVNGIEALEQVLNRPPGAPYRLFLVDVNMPKMDGYRFVRELRRLPAAAQAPVVMVSTEARPQDAAAARRAGANAYLVKPARPRDLVLTAALLLGDGVRAARAAGAEPGAQP